jgi:hypothetical protein
VSHGAQRLDFGEVRLTAFRLARACGWILAVVAFRHAVQILVPTGSLPDLLRSALEPLAPALNAAEVPRTGP